jgi:AraC-like DNA-binding protein
VRAETRKIYPFWDPAPPAIPARSRLYPLEPIGVGTGEVEGLSSYLLRLAAEHCLPPGALFGEMVAPLVRESRLLSTTKYPELLLYRAARAINGMGVTAAACVQALESLTLRTDLRWLTTTTWQGIFTTQYWLRPVRAWCPACFESQRHEDRIIFEPLLWASRAVTVCPIHKRALVTVCPHCRGESLPLTRKSRPGHCPKCLRWLGSMEDAEHPSDESLAGDRDWRLWAAKAVGELFAAPPGMVAPPERSTLRETIARCRDHFTEGCTHAFAHHFGIDDSLLRVCLKKHTPPGLEMVLRIGYLSGVSPLGLVNGTAVFPDPASRKGMFVCPPTQHIHKKYRRYGQERLILQEVLNETPPPSPAEVAARLQYRPTASFRHAHPELYRQIKARHTAFRQEQKRPRVIEQVSDGLVAERTINVALQEHPPPSAREVARRIGYSRSDELRRHFPEFYRQIRDRRDEYQKQMDEAVRNCFQSAMSEDQPPTVPELARRLGFIAASTLKANYPDLCRALDARRPEYRQRRLAQIETVLKQACHERPAPTLKELANRCGYQTCRSMRDLFPELCRQIAARFAAERKEWVIRAKAQLLSALDEAVPPSVKELSRRLGYEKGTLYRLFPEQCAELSARRARYIEEEDIKRKQQRREEIRQAVIELHNQGIYPSYRRIGEQISRPSGLLGFFDSEVLQEVKRELGIHTIRR